MKIMFSAGETSGDLHGAALAKGLKTIDPAVEMIGFGGPQMASEGVRLLADMRDYSVMGIWEVMKNLKKLFALRNKLVEDMKREKPDLLVLIDYPDFNWRLAAKAKEAGIKVFSYIPPSAWAWRKGRAKSCSAIADEFVVLYPFEMKPYKEAGAKISFQGNPLVDQVHGTMTKEEAWAFFQVPEGKRPVLLLPGSRRQEIALLFPVMLESAKRIQAQHPDVEYYLPVAGGIDRSKLEEMIKDAGIEVHLTESNTYDLMSIGEFALATSGTVVLESAIMGLPCIVLYRMSPLTYLVGRLMVHVEFISLPNILTGRAVIPELLQDDVTPERIFSEAERFFSEDGYGENVRAGLREAVEALGSPGGTKRVAECIYESAKNKTEALPGGGAQ